MIITPLPSTSPLDDLDVVDDLALGFAPRCPGCLHLTEPCQTGRGAAWRCPECDMALMS